MPYTDYEKAEIDKKAAEMNERVKNSREQQTFTASQVKTRAPKSPMPKQKDYSSLKEYSEAMRKWRKEEDERTEAKAQSQALDRMK